MTISKLTGAISCSTAATGVHLDASQPIASSGLSENHTELMFD